MGGHVRGRLLGVRIGEEAVGHGLDAQLRENGQIRGRPAHRAGRHRTKGCSTVSVEIA